MRDWDIKTMLIAMLTIVSTFRLAFAGLLLWAFQETDTPILRLSLWMLGIGMIVYVIWRIFKLAKFLKFEKNFS